jgi:hypothetical protein
MPIRGYRFVKIALLPSRCRIVTPACHPLINKGSNTTRLLVPTGQTKVRCLPAGEGVWLKGLATSPGQIG